MKKIYACIFSIAVFLMLIGCGSKTNSELDQFKDTLEAFCSKVSELNDSINKVNATDENAAEQVLQYLDQLDRAFQEFSDQDFPTKYSYLKPLADDAAEYMSNAVKSFHESYGDEFNEDLASYARENSARALKRIQALLSLLREDK